MHLITGPPEGEKSMNPRMSINNSLEIIQKDLDNIEKRLMVITEELLGPRPAPNNQTAEEKKLKAKGWLNQVKEKLDDFRNQLGKIKELEKDLRGSIIGSPLNLPDEHLLQTYQMNHKEKK